MELINKLKTTAQQATSAAAARVEQVRSSQKRKALLVELGELTYRQHQGEDLAASAFTPVLTELDHLGVAAGDEDSTSEA